MSDGRRRECRLFSLLILVLRMYYYVFYLYHHCNDRQYNIYSLSFLKRYHELLQTSALFKAVFCSFCAYQDESPFCLFIMISKALGHGPGALSAIAGWRSCPRTLPTLAWKTRAVPRKFLSTLALPRQECIALTATNVTIYRTRTIEASFLPTKITRRRIHLND